MPNEPTREPTTTETRGVRWVYWFSSQERWSAHTCYTYTWNCVTGTMYRWSEYSLGWIRTTSVNNKHLVQGVLFDGV